MLDSGDQAVVVGHGVVTDEDRAAAAALILVALKGIRDREQETRSLVACRGAGVPAAPGLTAAGPVVTMPAQPVPPAPQTPGI